MSRTELSAAPNRGLAATKAAEAELLRRYSDTRDPRIKEELVERLMPLARSMAMRYHSGSEPLDDLIQVAALGLVKAIDGFDPERGRAFASYAVPTMLGELRRHFRDHVWGVHLPRSLQESTRDVRDAIETLSDRLGRSPTVRQVAEHLDVGEEEVLEALQASDARKTMSLDAPRSVDEAQSAPMIETVPSAERGYEAIESQLAAEQAGLDEREHLILRLRFGEDMTQAEIGRRLGVSQMQISLLMRRALAKLLEAVQDDEPPAGRQDADASVAAA